LFFFLSNYIDTHLKNRDIDYKIFGHEIYYIES